jgi:hypothetical protein
MYGAVMADVRLDPAPRFTNDGEPCRSETIGRYAGPYVLELASVVSPPGLHVETVYVAGPGTRTQVTDLLIAGGEKILATRTLAEHPILDDTGRLRCLRDHLNQVETFGASLGCPGLRAELGAEAPSLTHPRSAGG